MRRAGLGLQPPASNGSTSTASLNAGGLVTTHRRRRRDRSLPTSTTTAAKGTTGASSSYPVFFFLFAVSLVLADVLYLYRLSTRGMVDGVPKFVWSASGGGGGNSSVVAKGAPELPHNHLELEAEHHQRQQQLQRERSPPQPPLNMLYQQSLAQGFHNLDDKEPIFKILQQAMIEIEDLDQETIDELPTWAQIQRLYGSEPIILGLERCDAFVAAVEPIVRFFGVAGTFNSGTNLGKYC
jgi:hypothetical protein